MLYLAAICCYVVCSDWIQTSEIAITSHLTRCGCCAPIFFVHWSLVDVVVPVPPGRSVYATIGDGTSLQFQKVPS